MLQVRRACPSEALPLTSVAVRGEAYWGFGDGYMNAFRERYLVSREFIEANHVFVATDGDAILGFFTLIKEASTACLEFMYIDPGCLGRGIGRILWNHMIEYCRLHRWEAVQFVCGPEPKAFYLKMGAKVMGEEESKVVPGRRILKLEVSISQPHPIAPAWQEKAGSAEQKPRAARNAQRGADPSSHAVFHPFGACIESQTPVAWKPASTGPMA
jgi:GNAT superfamily N-acetyltransferase